VTILKSWWKMALTGAGILFVISLIGGLIVGSSPAKATADNAVKACRSSDYAPAAEFLGSRSSVRPDGTWTPRESSPGIYTMDQRVKSGSTPDPYSYDGRYTTNYTSWTCTAYMDKAGLWTAVWDAHTGLGLVDTWHVKDNDLRSVAAPRDLSSPGYGYGD
jgi:hypothetical protein